MYDNFVQNDIWFLQNLSEIFQLYFQTQQSGPGNNLRVIVTALQRRVRISFDNYEILNDYCIVLNCNCLNKINLIETRLRVYLLPSDSFFCLLLFVFATLNPFHRLIPYISSILNPIPILGSSSEPTFEGADDDVEPKRMRVEPVSKRRNLHRLLQRVHMSMPGIHLH